MPLDDVRRGTREARGSSPAQRYARWGVALLLAGIAAWLSARQVHWPDLVSILAQSRPGLLALALGTVLLTTLAKAARWWVLLLPCRPRATPLRVLRVLFIGQMANNFLSRLGDVMRALLLGPAAEGGIPAVLGTLLAEKALDGVLGLLILVGLALWTPLPTWLRGPILGLSVLTAGLLLLLAWAARGQVHTAALFRHLGARLPAAIWTRVEDLVTGLALGLGLLRVPAQGLLALGLSLLVWILSASTNVILLAALGIDAPAWITWLVLATGYAATFLPTVPGQFGIFEYAAVLALSVVGVEAEPALAFGLVLHLLVYGPPAIVGPLAMAFEGLSWKGLRNAPRDLQAHASN